MRIRDLHPWDVSIAEARRLQRELAGRVELCPLPPGPALIAGADVAFSKERGLAFASVVVLEARTMEPVERATASSGLTFPYVPGLLTFREGSALLAALRGLECAPDVVIFDGQGLAHPGRIGLASHMGLWLERPTVGCAKSRLIGEHEEPGRRKGRWTVLRHEGEQIGAVLRTRTDVRPVYVSPGHLSDFDSARELVLGCSRKYRLPEPTRRAHLAVSRFKKAVLEGG
jgi:deoxyribonuclease V